MSKDTDNNYINTLDPILRAALKSLDLQPETEVERYERFKNIMANLATREHNTQIMVAENSDSQLQTKAEAITKKYSGSPVKLPNFGNRVVNNSEANFLKKQILSLVHQPDEEPQNSEAESEETITGDYFESSENLLQSLKEEQFSDQSGENTSQGLKILKAVQESLLTPFGVGSVLMLLCTGGLLLGYLGWNNLLNAESASSVGNTENNKPPQNSQSGGIATANLDLRTISTLKPNSNPFVSSPTASQTSKPLESQSADKPVQSVEVTRGGADLASALLPPSLRSEASQAGVNFQNRNPELARVPISSSFVGTYAPNIAPVPVPAPPPPKTTKATNPSANRQSINQVKFFGDYYYVLAQNNDANSLTQARKIVKDAYLAQFPQGVRIQMGAFDNQKDAQELLQRLKQEGIAGEIYRSK
jgi:hypothetical protein